MIRRPKGTEDILPVEVSAWQRLEGLIRKVCDLYNYKEIRTPIFEAGELFHRSENDASDMVTKETYDFKDKADRSLTLRPEGTAGSVRAFIENKLYVENPVSKVYYVGPIFRYERPQKGRQRQFHQFGIESYGSNDPLMEVECIALACTIIKSLGLKDIKVKLNTLGDEKSRNDYRTVLVDYFKNYEDDLCPDCKERLKKNPLRVLDCKVDKEKDYFKDAPKITSYLTEESKEHFAKVVQGLENLGIEYEIDENLVRGLDYYTYTVFEIEINSTSFGAQNVICAGGRYNNLVKELGGPDTPAVGLAFGMERLILAVLHAGGKLALPNFLHMYVIALGQNAKNKASQLINEYRLGGLSCDMDYLGGSLKSQFKKADKNGALFTAILGDSELENGVINIKNNETDIQETINIDDVYDYVVGYLRSKSGCGSCSGSCHHEEE